MRRGLEIGLFVVALLFGADRAAAQNYPVTFEMQSVMETFFNETGTIGFREYEAAFVPESGLDAEVVLANEAGEVLGRFPFFDSYRSQERVFAQLQVVGPAEVALSEPGLYNIFFLVDGEVVTRMPFVMRAMSDGSDPFDPQKTYAFDGFWRQLAHMTEVRSASGPAAMFTFWTGGADLPEAGHEIQPGIQGDRFLGVLYDGETIVAHTRRRMGLIADGHYTRNEFQLYHPHAASEEPNARLLLMEDIAELDGNYVLRVFRQSDNAVLRQFPIKIEDGALVQHERAVLGYEPQMDFLLPQVRSKHTGQEYLFIEAVWLESR